MPYMVSGELNSTPLSASELLVSLLILCNELLRIIGEIWILLGWILISSELIELVKLAPTPLLLVVLEVGTNSRVGELFRGGSGGGAVIIGVMLRRMLLGLALGDIIGLTATCNKVTEVK